MPIELDERAPEGKAEKHRDHFAFEIVQRAWPAGVIGQRKATTEFGARDIGELKRGAALAQVAAGTQQRVVDARRLARLEAAEGARLCCFFCCCVINWLVGFG